MGTENRLGVLNASPETERRKREEADFHDMLRSASLRDDPAEYARLTSNKKYYAAAQASMEYYKNWLRQRCAGKRVLDYGCGDGEYSAFLAANGAMVTGVDISDVSVKNARARASAEGLDTRVSFRVMDCERLEFPNDSFDIVCEAGVLHHLDFRLAIGEIARVVKPEGAAICYEALGHNPVIQAYRDRTPHLRTAYEAKHIIRAEELRIAEEYFGKVQSKFFHLCSLLAMPLRNTPAFPAALKVLEKCDDVLLSMPGIKWQAWMVISVMEASRR